MAYRERLIAYSFSLLGAAVFVVCGLVAPVLAEAHNTCIVELRECLATKSAKLMPCAERFLSSPGCGRLPLAAILRMRRETTDESSASCVAQFDLRLTALILSDTMCKPTLRSLETTLASCASTDPVELLRP